MRSIYIKVLLWCFGILLLSLVAFGFVSTYVFTQMAGKNSFFERMNDLQLEEARQIYESEGPARLQEHLQQVNKILGGSRYLTDAKGRDLISGDDLSPLLAKFGSQWSVSQTMGDRIAVVVASADDRYRLLVVADSPFQMRQYIPYYLPILLGLAILCWLLAWRIAAPLRELVGTVDRFGMGDLTARVRTRRHDEIGELGVAFDRMAERIGTLLTAERRLLQDISHELRSPLARLSFAAELTRTADDRDAAAARLKKEILRLTNLVDALLQTIQAEGDQASIEEESVQMDELLREVIDDCRVEAESRACGITFHGKPDVVVRGDSELLRRAMENVVRNAIRYTPEHTSVEVELTAHTETAKVTVRDYGPGVPEDVLPKIFQPFFRVDDSRNGSTGGVGLGLTIANRAITLHRGRLWAENSTPGYSLPLRSPHLFTKLKID
jgi:signal transduction histidine kinase